MNETPRTRTSAEPDAATVEDAANAVNEEASAEDQTAVPSQRPAFDTERSSKHELPTAVMDVQTLSGDGNAVLAACLDGVYRLDIKSDTAEKLYDHESYASGVVVDEQRGLAISAGYDGQLIWYDLASRSVVRRVLAHSFWSWQLAVSNDGRTLASVTGQYLAGSNEYAPAPEQEPSVKLLNAITGDVLHQLPHVPSVQAVAFSPDGQFVAAGNLMGEVRVWRVDSGELAANWTTDALTSWGIIKSHCYIGGIHALAFSPDGQEVIVAGMGPMRDPMAGNGRQLWQRFAWQEPTPRLLDQTHEGESGEGLMETLAFSPCGRWFVMGGRQRGGDWNAATFDQENGSRVHQLSTGYRMTTAHFDPQRPRLITAGSNRQKKPKDGVYPPFGVVEIYGLTGQA